MDSGPTRWSFCSISRGYRKEARLRGLILTAKRCLAFDLEQLRDLVDVQVPVETQSRPDGGERCGHPAVPLSSVQRLQHLADQN